MSNWVDEDELTITYGTLRKAMAESAEAERERIMALLLAECDCEDMYRCTYHRMTDVIKGGQS